MLIKGYFRNIKDELYSVYILSDNDNSEELVIGDNGLYFGSEPVTIEEDNDTTFDTIIRKSATINLVTRDYIGGKLFANNSRNIKVNILKEGQCVFAGFVEPNTFSQPFISQLDEFSINCTDALSTLQYYNYKNITANNFDTEKIKAGIASFKSIIEHMFTDLISLDINGVTTGRIFYDKSKGVSSGKEESVFSDLGMSELYLVGEEADDVWTNEDILKEILQYLNLHIKQEGFDYYIYDWNTIKNGRNNWKDILSDTTLTTTPQAITLNPDMYASSNTSINISDVYNQVSVSCDLESQDTVIESPLDEDNLISFYSGKQKYMTEYISEGSGDSAVNAFRAIVKGEVATYDSAKESDWYLQAMTNNNWRFLYDGANSIENLYERSGDRYVNQWKVAKYLKDNPLTPCLLKLGNVTKQSKATDNSLTSKVDMSNYLYISVNGNEVDSEEGHKPNDDDINAHSGMIKYVGNKSGGVFSPVDANTTNYLVFTGSILLQPIVYESSSTVAKRGGTYYDNLTNGTSKYEGSKATVPNYDGYSQDSSLYILSANNLVKSDNNEEGRYYTRKFYTTETPNSQPTQYLTEGASLQPWTEDKSAHGYKFEYTSIGDGSDKISKLPILECELKIGNKYCVETNIAADGSSTFEWLTIEQIRTRPDLIYIDDDGTTIYKKTFSLGINPKIGDYIVGDEFSIQNTIDYTMNLDVEGTAIPIKKSDALTGSIQFTILGPINLIWDSIVRRHKTWFRHTKWTSTSHFILSHVENIIIKDFECKICTDNGGNEVTEDKDLVYMSNETDKYISKKDDIDFKFVTQLSSIECVEKGVKPSINLNSVIDNTTSLPLTSIYNSTTNETAKAEEHYVDQYFSAYSTPKIMLETDLDEDDTVDFRNTYVNSVLSRTFFIQSMSRDLRNSTVHLIMREI